MEEGDDGFIRCDICKSKENVTITSDDSKTCLKCVIKGKFKLIHTENGKKYLEAPSDKIVLNYVEKCQDWRTIHDIRIATRVRSEEIFPLIRRLYRQGKLHRRKFNRKGACKVHLYKFRITGEMGTHR